MIFPSTESNKHLPIIKKAHKCFCYDINDKPYLDFIGGNNTVILGHDMFFFTISPRFSGKSYLEDRVSERLSEYTLTKYFRYFKNGTDAVSCAIRLARHIIGLNNSATILFIGYGGSNNEFVSTIDRNSGVPVQLSTQDFRKDYSYDIVVYESRYRKEAESVKSTIRICDHLKSGILGLDEPTDDIDLYGKSLANGYPVSVMTGNDEYMKEINNIYYSTTFGGENVGLEAIDQTLNKFDPIVKNNYLEMLDYAKSVLPKWTSLDGKTIKKFVEKGILFNGNWQLMTCHTKDHILRLSQIIDELM